MVSEGTVGVEQPLKTISSMNIADVALFAPTTFILKLVVLVPVVAAVIVPEANQLPLDAVMVERVEYAPPSALE